jgi:hypothetical protein
MKSIKIAGFYLAAMLVVSLVVAAAASAGPVFEQCRENAGSGTKWEDKGCSKASGTGKWEWKELTTTEKTISSGTLTLQDTKVPIVGTVEVICGGTDEGAIGPGKFDRVTVITPVNCKAGKNCEEVKKVEARNLPWQTELFETESTVRDAIKEGEAGAKEPGWKVECKVLGVTKADECISNKQSVSVSTDFFFIGFSVLLSFLKNSGKAKCEVGGAESGVVEGFDAVSSSEGWSIRAS